MIDAPVHAPTIAVSESGESITRQGPNSAWKPFVTLIWLGGGLVALGGFLSVIGRVRRERRGRLEEAWA